MALLPSDPVRGTDNSAWLRGRRLNGKCILRRVRGRARVEKREHRPTRTLFDPLKSVKKTRLVGIYYASITEILDRSRWQELLPC